MSSSSSSSSANANDLATLQAAVKDLQSFQLNLPPSHQFDKENSSNTSINTNSTTTALLKKYKTARQHYIQQRTTELFLDHLQQYNPRTHSFPLPAPITSSERTALQSRQEDVITAVRQTMESVNGALEEVHLKYEQLEEKKEEFVGIVDGMERAEHQRIMNNAGTADDADNNNDSMYQDDMDEDEEEITEQDVMEQEEHLHQLQQRKIELENRLRSVRLQIGTVEGDVHQIKGVVNEVRVKSGRKPLDWRGVDAMDATATNGDGGGGTTTVNNDDDVEYICNDVDNEIAELQEKAAELKQSGEFYDGIRELMEELGGVKILSTSTTTTTSSSEEGEGFTLTLKLLGTHVLEIQLKSGVVAGSVGVGDTTSSLVVASAKLVTPTTFPMPEPTPPSDQMTEDNTENLTETINQSLTNISLSKIMSQKQTVSIVIPPLDDLVHWSRSLESSQGIRFVLVETMARIRTLDARVAELTYLRQNYAAQVYDMDTAATTTCGSSEEQQPSSCQFGGAEQEVVCAINEGITVALRLTVDCPLVPGSVYISELFGVGGWEEKKLETLKKVVEERRCKGPVEVMEVMVKEIRRRRLEEGWAIPLTPSLPRGRN
mmetsp:Transcript_905/g.1399  ORF Transcript_905/g.1399 Transcript_905/m.1399 type:complete len:604 (+) Transcript_905:170-1981(+)